MLLSDRVAIITGAAGPRGIGRATASVFAAQGARLVLADLDGEAIAAAAAAVGAEHRGLACDVRDGEACRLLVEATIAAFGRLDIVVNAAGVSRPTRLMEIAPDEYDLVFAASMKGTFNMTRAAIPQLRAQRGGSIICFGSVAAQRGGGIFGGAHYAAAKGAIHAFAKAAARELGPEGIRVNAIAPGLVDTDIFEGKLTEEMRTEIARNVPLGRIARPGDIANACLYLASELSAYVTGSVLDVNGGLHIH